MPAFIYLQFNLETLVITSWTNKIINIFNKLILVIYMYAFNRIYTKTHAMNETILFQFSYYEFQFVILSFIQLIE